MLYVEISINNYFICVVWYLTLEAVSLLNFETHSLIFRAGTIRSSAVSIRIWYRPSRYDTYSIRYTFIWLKVLKSIILYFNNKVNVLNWSKQWILQMLVIKHNDRFPPKIISSTWLRSNSIGLSLLLIVWKSSVKRIVRNSRCFLQLSPSIASVQHDGRIDTYRLMSVSILYRYWLYRPSPTDLIRWQNNWFQFCNNGSICRDLSQFIPL